MKKFKLDKTKRTKISSLAVNVNKGAIRGGLSRVTHQIKQKGK